MTFRQKLIGHFCTVCRHKYYVFLFCCKAGIPWQGLIHDMSKFSPEEFWESVKYYQGNDSPINACKKANGISYAWLHHRGRNKHHYLYWVDDFDKGMIPKQMLFKYALEMICDFLAAGKAYSKDKFTLKSEYEWWEKNHPTYEIHKQTKKFVDMMMKELAEKESLEPLNYKHAKRIYAVATHLTTEL